MSELKSVACQAIEKASEDLHRLSKSIWNRPELGFEERHAHSVLTDFLEKAGFQVERSFKLETAFRATHGSSDAGCNVAVISEYDALPEIGHACGHNLIAEVGVAAGLGIKAAIEEAGGSLGKVTVLGTPAEEGMGGKIDLIRAGAFDDVDVAMMSHPFPDNDSAPLILAREIIQVTYKGKPSHAAGYPWEGVNALDAAVLCYQGLACLRQQIKPDCRIHCIILKGGVKVNIIPETAVLQVGIRAPTEAELHDLRVKVTACFKSAATATGCQLDYQEADKTYASMLHNEPILQLYETNLGALQTSPGPKRKGAAMGSTDMGNVSQVVPSIHPIFHVGGVEVNHTRGFTADVGLDRAQPYTLTQGKALAMTAIDILLSPEKLAAIKSSFLQSTQG